MYRNDKIYFTCKSLNKHTEENHLTTTRLFLHTYIHTSWPLILVYMRENDIDTNNALV
jgi:hypothetical protein